MKSNTLKWMLNLYPPYWATGISVKTISSDFKTAEVQMKMRFYNSNFVKTHFGGSLYAMIDPFFMLMFIQILGKGYVVWDQSASINFIKPGKGTVKATFLITDYHINSILENTKSDQKYVHTFDVTILNQKSEIVANATKTLYFRKKLKK